jgi:Tfp pilus assembly protein PilV
MFRQQFRNESFNKSVKTVIKKLKKIYHNKSGFTVLETLVAVAMLSLVIGTIMALIQTSLIANSYAKDQVTAKYLAEEGVEYIRNLRDQNVTNNGAANWMQNIAALPGSPCGNMAVTSAGASCYVDAINGGLPQVCSGSCPALKFEYTTGKFSYTGGLPSSRFTRTIQVMGADGSPGNANNVFSVKVRVVVSWTEGTHSQTFTLTDYLFNWYTP